MVRTFHTSCCGHEFTTPLTWPEHIKGATFDCPDCGALMIFLDNFGKNVEFHKYMHEKTGGRWPLDGANTGYIEFAPDDDATRTEA